MPARAATLALVLAVLPLTGSALDALDFQAQALTGDGWSSGPLDIEARLDADGRLALRARARRLSLPAPLDSLREATFECPGARWDGTGIHCRGGVLEFATSTSQTIRLRGDLDLDSATGRFSLDAAEQPVAGGRLELHLAVGSGGARVRARFSGLALPLLAGGVALLVGELPVQVTAGTVSGQVDASRAGARGRGEATLTFEGVGYSDATGLRVGESLSGQVRISGQGPPDTFEFAVDARLDAGLVYEDPLLLEFAGEPLTVTFEGRGAGDDIVDIHTLTVHDPTGARLSGSGVLALSAPSALRDLDLHLDPVPAARLYQRYLKAFAGVGAISNLELRGQVSAQMQWRGGEPMSASLELDAVDAGDRDGRVSLFGVSGNLQWRSGEPEAVSDLVWSGAQIQAVDLGAGAARGVLAGRGLRLTRPLVIPVLDGRIRIERLEARALGTADARVEADLEVEPLSLERLSNRLAWLPLAGSVSGRFPSLTYTDRRLAVNGDVRIRLFDGDVTVSDLTLEDPLGVVPRLQADVVARGIDLEVLTRAFSFGSIEGRLDGDVRGLVLEGWQPLSFDAVLATPEGDTSRHRISQRAVDNLASLGGANAVLSSTFLRIFQEFSYDRLGLSCRLQAGVCEMGGVAPADAGYYIVKGGGMPPRVDVVGFNSRVDWKTLVDRLKAVASSEGPVIR